MLLSYILYVNTYFEKYLKYIFEYLIKKGNYKHCQQFCLVFKMV